MSKCHGLINASLIFKMFYKSVEIHLHVLYIVNTPTLVAIHSHGCLHTMQELCIDPMI